MTESFTHYSDLQTALEALEPPLFPSEIHGGLCGLLSGKDSPDAADWINSLLPGLDDSNLLQRDVISLLRDVYSITVKQLNDPTCDFHLLIPGDDSPLAERVEALSDWCQGYLTGLTEGGVTNNDGLPEDVQEIMRDISQIAGAGSSFDLQESEENEEAYQELVEYIRVGALLINEELHPVKSAPEGEPVLH